jgi:AsmA-like protein
MAPKEKSRFWRRCRILFRRFRICVLALVLILLGALLYVNQIGLPGFLKRPLQNKLRAHGLELQFTRMRWRWDRGLVAENVRFGSTNAPSGPQLTAKAVQVQISPRALLKFQIQVTGLRLRDGRLTWSVIGTNESPREVAIQNIQTDLRLPGDLWELDNFQAEFAGAEFQLTGAVTNASAIREWKILQDRRRPAPGTFEARLRQLADMLEQIRFSAPPQLKADLRGDARDPNSFAFRLSFDTPEADTPWGNIQHSRLAILLRPATSNATSHAEINLQAENMRTRWGSATNLLLKLNVLSTGPNMDSAHADLDLTAAQIDTEWGGAAGVHFNAEWFHALTNSVPVSGHGEWEADQVLTRWGGARHLHGIATLSTPANPAVIADASWGRWTNLAPFNLYWEGLARGIDSPKLEADEMFCSGEWSAPRLSIERLSARLYGGKLDGQGALDVATRRFQFSSSSDFDGQKISPLLTEKGRQWLAQFSWKVPPTIKAAGELTLPEWTNLEQADWRAEVRPTVRIDGEFRGENGTFRKVPFSYALSSFSYSNFTWRLPDLVATRPEGRVNLSYEGNEQTHDYVFRIRSSIDPHAIRPLFETNQQRAFDLVSFGQPPVVDGEVRGRWYEPERISATARVALTNFSVRGEWLGDGQASVEYTNLQLKAIEPRLQRGTQQMAAACMIVDFPGKKIYLTNGVSTIDPGPFTRALGPKIAKHIEPYQFSRPPTVRAQGIIPLQSHHAADIHFDVNGGPFEWWRFKVPRIEGKIDWVGDHLKLRNVQPNFYQGTALANAEFDFSPERGADFWFDFSATDADMRSFMTDVTGKSNPFEGLLTGRLLVTQANTTDWTSWQGGGRVTLRDGMIWAIPIFGVLTPVLDSISPGLGSSRAREGTATYLITNGVVRFDDLEIRASMMRLQYRGTVDLQGRVDARVQAELLRDTWVIGRVLSLALWPITKVFEYKLSGTLKEPKSEPLYIIPKILLLPFHAFGGGKSTPEPTPDWSRTNAPPSAIK